MSLTAWSPKGATDRDEVHPAPGAEDGTLTINRLVFLLLAAGVIVCDLITKRIISTTFYRGEIQQVVGDWIQLTYIHNPGAAFGLFPGNRYVLVAVSVVAAIVVLVVGLAPRTRLRSSIPLGLILGGAVGNLVDRIRLGEVVDFIRVGIPPDNYWPVFNVADSAVTVGVLWLAVALARDGRQEAAAESAHPGDPDPGGRQEEDGVAPVAPSRGEP